MALPLPTARLERDQAPARIFSAAALEMVGQKGGFAAVAWPLAQTAGYRPGQHSIVLPGKSALVLKSFTARPGSKSTHQRAIFFGQGTRRAAARGLPTFSARAWHSRQPPTPMQTLEQSGY